MHTSLLLLLFIQNFPNSVKEIELITMRFQNEINVGYNLTGNLYYQ